MPGKPSVLGAIISSNCQSRYQHKHSILYWMPLSIAHHPAEQRARFLRWFIKRERAVLTRICPAIHKIGTHPRFLQFTLMLSKTSFWQHTHL